MNTPLFPAAIYARCSSANQRPESIGDQVKMCRRKATELGYTILEDHIYFDEAQAGTKIDRKQLTNLLEEAMKGKFSVILVDDLAGLTWDAVFTLTMINDLLSHGVRVVSAADGLDTSNPDHMLQIRMMAFIYEQASAMRKSTLHGKIGKRKGGRK